MMDALIESKPIMAQMTCILNQHPHMDFKSSTVLEISQHSGTIDHGETYHDSCRTTMMNSSQVYPSSYWVGYFYSPHGFARVWPLREILHCLNTILNGVSCTSWTSLSIVSWFLALCLNIVADSYYVHIRSHALRILVGPVHL